MVHTLGKAFTCVYTSTMHSALAMKAGSLIVAMIWTQEVAHIVRMLGSTVSNVIAM